MHALESINKLLIMNKRFTFLLLLMLSASMFAQNTDFYFEARLNTLNTPFSSLDSTAYSYTLIRQIIQSNAHKSDTLHSEKMDSILKQDDLGNLEKEVPEYDSTGNVIKYSFYQKVETDTAWTISNFSTISYDTLGNISTIANYTYEYGNNDSIPNFQTVISYKSQDTISAINELVWNSDSAKWIHYWKSEMTYNSSNQLEYYLTYDFENSGQTWKLTDSLNFYYGKSGFEEVSYSYYNFNYSQKWISLYNYDESGTLIECEYNLKELANNLMINIDYGVSDNPQFFDHSIDYESTYKYIYGEYTYDEETEISDVTIPSLFFLNPLFSDRLSLNKPLTQNFFVEDDTLANNIKITYCYSGAIEEDEDFEAPYTFYSEFDLNVLNTPFSVLDTTPYQYRFIRQINFSNNIKSTELSSETLDSILIQDETENTRLEIPVYNSIGQVITYGFYAKSDDDQDWQKSASTHISYNNEGSFESFTNYVFNTTSGDSVPYFQTVIDYSTEDTISSITEFMWKEDSLQWKQHWKAEFFYDQSKELSYSIDYRHSNKIDGWMKSDSIAYTIGSLAIYVDQYTYDDSKYTYFWKDIYSLSKGNIASNTFTTKNVPTSYSANTFFEYENNNPVQIQQEISVGKYSKSIVGSYTFNKNTQLTNISTPGLFFVNPIYSDGVMTNKPLSFECSITDDTLETKRTVTYIYSGGATAVKDITTEGLYVYPNPANEQVCFTWEDKNNVATLELYDLTGAQVLSQTITNGESISLANKASGIYLYKLNFGSAVKTGKLIVR